jgi:hypothetical protein
MKRLNAKDGKTNTILQNPVKTTGVAAEQFAMMDRIKEAAKQAREEQN